MNSHISTVASVKVEPTCFTCVGAKRLTNKIRGNKTIIHWKAGKYPKVKQIYVFLYRNNLQQYFTGSQTRL